MMLSVSRQFFVAGVIALWSVIPSYAQDEPERAIIEITEDLYLAQNNLHNAIFLVTEEGIVLVDPINTDFSVWLKGELSERFDVPVRYVLYSHHHGDHASGGAVFEDTALYVGHENVVRELELGPPDTPLTGNAAEMDANGDGRLQRGETSGNRERNFDLIDFDRDGELSGAEIARGSSNDIVVPDLTYRDRMTVTLGGKDVELIYTGVVTHTNDLSMIRFPDAKTLFVVDHIRIGRLPIVFPIQGGRFLNAWLNAIRIAEALDYEILASGHGVIGTRADATANRHYLEELRDQVMAGKAEGDSLEELQETIRMESYRNWAAYEQFQRPNVEAMYNMLTE